MSFIRPSIGFVGGGPRVFWSHSGTWVPGRRKARVPANPSDSPHTNGSYLSFSLFFSFSFGFDLWRMSMTGSSAYYVAHAIPPFLRLSNKTMLLLSTPPTTFFPTSTTPRVTLLSSTSSSSSSSISLRSSTAPSPSCSSVTPKDNCLASAKHSPPNMSASVSSRTFLNAQSEQGSLTSPLSFFFLSSHSASSLYVYRQLLRCFFCVCLFSSWSLLTEASLDLCFYLLV